jgi:transcriptional regulator GlxA family with amidase domain
MDEQAGVAAGWSSFYRGLLLQRRRGAHDLAVLERLRRARVRMAADAGTALDLAAMAETACFSKFHFLRLFRQAYGETPARYLSQLRLERARTLLETTDRSVSEICLAVGFESLPSFSCAFRKHTGNSPLRYRRRWVAVPRPGGPPLRVPGCFLSMYG